MQWTTHDEAPLKPCGVKTLLQAFATVPEFGARVGKSGRAVAECGCHICGGDLQQITQSCWVESIGTTQIYAVCGNLLRRQEDQI